SCLLFGQLANDGVGIAVQGYRAPFCDIFGPIDLDPGSAFADRGTPYTLLDPGHPDVGALRVMAQGTESGLFALVLFSGELIIHADDVRIEWGEGTGPDTYTLSDVQPEITSVYVGQPCYADLDRSGELDVFDFLDFQNAFAAGSLRADCDVDGSLDFFDFLCFLDAFDAGCADR
ncbi:MAG: GC-type dockerin domain-anchored protein, partial [Planctomycetota bacterium]